MSFSLGVHVLGDVAVLFEHAAHQTEPERRVGDLTTTTTAVTKSFDRGAVAPRSNAKVFLSSSTPVPTLP